MTKKNADAIIHRLRLSISSINGMHERGRHQEALGYVNALDDVIVTLWVAGQLTDKEKNRLDLFLNPVHKKCVRHEGG